MTDKAGQANIRGVDYTKLSLAYLEQALVFKPDLTQRTTANRQFVWFQETAGPLTQTAPASFNIAEGALPFVSQQSVTKNTTYVKMWKVDSPYITFEDLKDNQVNIWEMQVRNLSYALRNDIDSYVWDIISESQSPSTINSVITNAAWDAASGQDPIEDIEEAKMDILNNSGYDPETNGGTLYLNTYDYKSLVVWLISTKGSSWTEFSSSQIKNGVIMRFRGLNVKKSVNVTTDYAMVAIPSAGASWYSFMPMQTAFIEEPLIGRKLRMAVEGAATLDRPKCFSLISNTQA